MEAQEKGMGCKGGSRGMRFQVAPQRSGRVWQPEFLATSSPLPKVSSCNSPWTVILTRGLPDKGWRPRQNKFVAPWAAVPHRIVSEAGCCPR